MAKTKAKKKKSQNIRVKAVTVAIAMLALLATILFLVGEINTGRKDIREIETTTYGIDVARYQGTIDWAEVAANGVDFAMIRVGYRTYAEGIIKEDSNARYNLQEATKAGIPVGVYFFSTAISQEEAKEEAAWVLDLISQYPITYPVVYDCEGFRDPENRHSSLTVEERTDNALVFLKAITKGGYEAMFYASKNEMENDLLWEVSRIEERYKVWVAQYPEQPYPDTPASTYSGTHHMWQYTQAGSIPGISAPVDLDIAYFGYEGTAQPQNTEPPAPAEPDVEAMMTFQEVFEHVTAKEEVNLRDIPSQDDMAKVMRTLPNGEVAMRTGVSSSGWSRLIYEGVTYYAVSSYLTTDLDGTGTDEAADKDGDGIETEFQPISDQVTAKEKVNLRSIPSVTDPEAKVITQLKHGDVVQRNGINQDVGWSRVIWEGQTLYCVTSYLEVVDGE